MPSLVRDTDPLPGRFGWQAWAEPVVGDPYLWCASFSSSVPHGLVAIFTSPLASPHPVQRACLPAGVDGRLTVIRSGSTAREVRVGRSEAGSGRPKLRAVFGPNGRRRPSLASFSPTDQATRALSPTLPTDRKPTLTSKKTLPKEGLDLLRPRQDSNLRPSA
ncbi:DUF317 domain-containing protein [Streptomyces gelaticus]